MHPFHARSEGTVLGGASSERGVFAARDWTREQYAVASLAPFIMYRRAIQAAANEFEVKARARKEVVATFMDMHTGGELDGCTLSGPKVRVLSPDERADYAFKLLSRVTTLEIQQRAMIMMFMAVLMDDIYDDSKTGAIRACERYNTSYQPAPVAMAIAARRMGKTWTLALFLLICMLVRDDDVAFMTLAIDNIAPVFDMVKKTAEACFGFPAADFITRGKNGRELHYIGNEALFPGKCAIIAGPSRGFAYVARSGGGWWGAQTQVYHAGPPSKSIAAAKVSAENCRSSAATPSSTSIAAAPSSASMSAMNAVNTSSGMSAA